jgi:hypothetical protein
MKAMNTNYKIRRFYKKLLNKFIARSLCLGNLAIFTTKVRATQTPSQGEPTMHKYNKEATEKLWILCS